MECDKISPIESQDRTFGSDRESQYLFIFKCRSGKSCFLNRQNIVAQPSQCFNDREWKVLV